MEKEKYQKNGFIGNLLDLYFQEFVFNSKSSKMIGAANIPATPMEWKSSECWFNGRWGLSCPVFVRRNFSLFRKINTNTFSAASWQIWRGKFALLSFRLFSPEWLTQNEAIFRWKPFIYRFHKNKSKNLSSFKFCFKCNTSQFYFVLS